MNVNYKYKKIFNTQFLFLLVVYIISIYPIIRINYNYIDDARRVNIGCTGWEDLGRYVSKILSYIIHSDTYLTDVSPLPQILAVVILTISSIILLHIITEKWQYTIIELISVIPLGLSPYFLECLSYKYDSPYMALSILAAIIPALFYTKKCYIYMLLCLICSLVVCMTYQPSTGIFPMIVAFVSLKRWNEGENPKVIFIRLLHSAVSYLSGLIIFKYLIFNKEEAYLSTSILNIKNILPGFIRNIKEYIYYILLDFKKEWIIYVLIIYVACLYIIVKNTKRKKFISFLVTSVTMFIMFLLCFGVYPFLEKPIYNPRAMYGFGIFIAIISIVVANSIKQYVPKLICFLLCWSFVTFSFTYGNALNEQAKYTDFRISMAIDDLKDLDVMMTDNTKKVQIVGTIGRTESLSNMPESYSLLNRLIPITFKDSNWYWGYYQFGHYYGIDNIKRNKIKDLETMDLPVVKDTIYHTIKANDKYILIKLK